MELIKHEQYLTQVMTEKGELLEDNFKKIQDYMNVCDSTFVGMVKSKTLYLIVRNQREKDQEEQGYEKTSY